jgi:prepilin-type N-terminal cleavage/methylation domain-containing protein
MHEKVQSPAAFTLIELLVVISIIAILAGIAMPVYSQATLNAKILKGTANARSIGMSLLMYANDNDGRFPNERNDHNEDITTANDAFRSLFPTYLTDESIFAVPTSKAGPLADNRITQPSDILTRGENHWAYVAGLNSSSNSQWPLIVDHTTAPAFTPTRRPNSAAPGKVPRASSFTRYQCQRGEAARHRRESVTSRASTTRRRTHSN